MLPNFPELAPLKLEDKSLYNQLVAEYPPFSNISFSSLHIWWNLDGRLSVSLLNNNLVIYYHVSHDTKNSGYSLIGKHEVDGSIVTLFDHLAGKGEPIRIVHIPDFVVEEIKDKHLYDIEEELDYNEYILDSAALASLDDGQHGRIRRKVNRFLKEVDDRQVEIKDVDLASEALKSQLFQAIKSWSADRPSRNDPNYTEHLALQKTLDNASALDIKALGLYVDDKLYGVVLYHNSLDKTYYIINHLKVDYSIPFIFDYVAHLIANKAVQENVKFLNMEMDLGIENLRRHKMGWRPVNFFRQYRISPHSAKQ